MLSKGQSGSAPPPGWAPSTQEGWWAGGVTGTRAPHSVDPNSRSGAGRRGQSSSVYEPRRSGRGRRSWRWVSLGPSTSQSFCHWAPLDQNCVPLPLCSPHLHPSSIPFTCVHAPFIYTLSSAQMPEYKLGGGLQPSP